MAITTTTTTISFKDFCHSTPGSENYTYEDYFDQDIRSRFEDYLNRIIMSICYFDEESYKVISVSYTVSFIEKNILYHYCIVLDELLRSEKDLSEECNNY